MVIKVPSGFSLPASCGFFQETYPAHRLLVKLVEVVKNLPYKGCEYRSGCFLAAYTRNSSFFEAKEFGEITDSNKKSKYLQCATEKVTRMVCNHLNTSFELANKKLGRHGGGVSFNDELFIACSGYPPEIDEAISYLVGFRAINYHLDRSFSMKEAKSTKNEFVLKLAGLVAASM